MKTCPKCGSASNGFFKNKTNKDGLGSQCKKCHTEGTLKRARENREIVNARRREWHATNREKISEARKQWRKEHPQTDDQKRRAAERACKWAQENQERRQEIARNWVRNNPGKAVAAKNQRRAAKYKARPSWVDLGAIKKVYLEAANKTRETGMPHEVDHIYPLRAKNFNGLHVPWNLQILPYREHRIKSGQESRIFQKRV